MKVPLSWLKKYVPVSILPEELAHRLTMAGNEVGDVERVGANWDSDKVLVGHILAVERHPNADRLTLPTVDLGEGETVTVVCGAPNVAAGQKIAFAWAGARLFSPRTGETEILKPARIRGVESSGMVCSALELGLGEDHEGIQVLAEDAPVGTPLVDYLGDTILDIEVTPNRPDCLSILGIAHEVAALTGERVTEPDLSYPEEGPPIESQASIEVADAELCYRYTASLVTGITIGPSPRWMQELLARVGQRPINNVVDITNYVMLEYDQPLHAFDFDSVKDRTIIVREARPGEVLTTLDGEMRTLGPPMLTIADATDAIGLAGVIGGSNSEVDEGTTSVLLESANFNPVNTRRTRTALGIDTEASYRFERGIRAELAPIALRRATQLILQIAGGKSCKGIVDIYPGHKRAPAVKISRERIEQVLGVDLNMDQVERVLASLGFESTGEPREVTESVQGLEAARTPQGNGTLWVKTPYWRSDISIEDDLVEEVARIVGYDTIPTTMLSASIPHQTNQPIRDLREHLRDLLVASGMQETISYPLTNLDALGKVDAVAELPEPLKVANPMSSELAYLRTTLRASVLETLASNRRTSADVGIRLFEIGRTYLSKALDRELPDEKEMLVGVLSGPRYPASWLASRGEMGFFDAKGVLESVFSPLGVRVRYEASHDSMLRPGRTARLICEGAAIGVAGEVQPAVLERFGLEDGATALFELDLGALAQAPQQARRHQTATRFPESYRDLALIVDADVPSAGIQEVIDRHDLVESSTPFDVYSGPGVPTGKKSVAFTVVFRSASRTLTAREVERAQRDILRQLERQLGAQLRE